MVKYFLIIILFCSCNTATPVTGYRDTIWKDTTIYKTKYRDSIVYKIVRKDTPVYIPIYIPAALQQRIKSGQVKYTIKYKDPSDIGGGFKVMGIITDLKDSTQ